MDLLPEKRKEFLEAYGCWDADVENSSTFPNNWDIFPIMVFDTDDVDFGSDLVDEYSYVVSILDDQNNPSDNLDNFGDINEAIAYAKEHQGAGVFQEHYLIDKTICEYLLVWHPDAEVVIDHGSDKKKG